MSCLKGIIYGNRELIGTIKCNTFIDANITDLSEDFVGKVTFICEITDLLLKYLYSSDDYALLDSEGIILTST